MTTAQTTAQNTATVQRLFEKWNAHDVDGILSCLTEDVVWVEPGVPAPLIGKEAVAKNLREQFEAFPDTHLPKEDLRIYSSEKAAFGASSWTWVATFQGRMQGVAPTGRRVRTQGTCVYEFRDGLISRHTEVFDQLSALTQAGLLPDQDGLVFRAEVLAQYLFTKARNLVRR